MKINHQLSRGALLLLWAGLAASAQAAGAISATQSNTGSIELTNLNEAGDQQDGPAAVQPGKAAVHAVRPSVAPQTAAAGKPKPALHKKKKNADGTDTEEDGDSEADVAAQDEPVPSGESADAAPVNGTPSTTTAQGTDGTAAYGTFNYSGGAMAGGASLATPGTGSGSGASSAGATAATTTGTGSSNQATTAGTGASGAGSQSGVDAQLASQLAQYRALMLQQATYSNLSNVNPALSRRYLAVDRATYQTRIGN